MSTQSEKSSKHELIEKFCKENEVELMHLEMYLDFNGIVCIKREEYEEGE